MKSWRFRLLLLLLASSVFLSVSRRELYVGDETKYAQVIRSMHVEHSIFVPTLNGTPFSHKPPVHFWLIYLLSDLFGVDSTWSFVIPSLVAFLALIGIVWWIGREFFDDETGGLAAFIFGSFYLIWGLAQTARMDLGFTALISLSALYAWRFVTKGEQRQLNWAGFYAGVATLVKGPMALGIILLAIVFEWIRRRQLPRVNPLPAILLAALIPLAWVVPAVMLGGRAFGEELLVKQNVGRAFDSFVHKEHFWYYLAHFPGTFAPWALLAIVAIVALYRRPQGAAEEPLRFSVSWFLAVLIPFSFISGKLDVYMVPAAVPLALVTARFIADRRDDLLAVWGVSINRLVTLLFAIIAITVLFVGPRYIARAPELSLLELPLVRGLFISLAAVAAIGFVVELFLREQKLMRTSVVFGLVALYPAIYLAAFLTPIANDLGSTDPLVRSLSRQPYSGSQIALYYCPFLWSRNMPPSLSGVRYIGEKGLTESGAAPPLLLATQALHSVDLGPALHRDYVKVDQVRMIGKEFDVYRRQ